MRVRSYPKHRQRHEARACCSQSSSLRLEYDVFEVGTQQGLPVKGPGKQGCDPHGPCMRKLMGVARGVGKAKLEEGLEARGLVRKPRTPECPFPGNSKPHWTHDHRQYHWG